MRQMRPGTPGRTGAVLLVAVTVLMPAIFEAFADESPDTWREAGRAFADGTVKRRKRAKNIIFFLGDGMGVVTVTAARIRAGQKVGKTGEEHRLSFDEFPFTALSRTFAYDFQTTDSAAGMTAPMCGVKTRNGVIACDQTCVPGDVSTRNGSIVPTFLEIAEEMGKSTGVVTTARVTHATPAACFSHSAHRDWEDDASLPADAVGKQLDIAAQAIGFPYGDGLEVLMGGGRRHFLPNTVDDPEDAGAKGNRKDGRNLTAEWEANGANWKWVWNQQGFDAIDAASCDHLLGLFERSHCEYETDRAADTGGEPSLSEMTGKAIDILKRNRKGFFLVVEGGRIDHALHSTNAYRALDETIEFAEAVRVAVDRCDPKDTLVIVTADHGHAITMNGYARRGNPILGIVENADGSPALGADSLPYPVLAFGIGPKCESAGNREVLTTPIAESRDFTPAAAYPGGADTHAGEDVPVYAWGACADRIHGVMDNTAFFYVMVRAFRADRKLPKRSPLREYLRR